MRVTCDRCLRRYDVPDAALKGRKIRARCKCGARILLSSADGSPPESTPESKGRPTRWFVDITSWEPITMDVRQLERAFRAGRIDADTLVWCKGMPDWRRLRDVDELAGRLLTEEQSAGLSSSRPLSSRPLSSQSSPAPEVPPVVVAAPSRSRTPQASYYVPSAGDTMPLQRVAVTGESAGDSSEQLAPAATLLDELEHRRDAAAEASAPRAELPEGLEPDASDVPPAATLEATPDAVAAAMASGDRGEQARIADGTGELGGRDVSSALAEAALFAAPDSSRSDAAASIDAPGDKPSTEASKAAATEAPASSRPAASQSSPRGASSARDVPSTAEPRPRGGQRNRRRSSSEETPAQKPSSLSVPPRAARTHRGRALVAVCGTLAMIWFVGRATMEQSTKPVAVSDAPAASEPATTLTPAGESPAHQGDGLPTEPAQIGDDPASRREERAPEVQSRPLQPPQVQATSALQPAQPPRVDTKPAAAPTPAAEAKPAAAPSTSPVATSSKPVPASASAVAPRPAPAPSARPAPAPARAPVAAQATPAAARPAATPPLTSAQPGGAAEPAAAGQPSTAVPQPAPRPGPFDMERAEQQMRMAAQAAASCGQAGPQRGGGQVKVLVEPWGRVVRVTHLEQGFVGTPVGICVMQAYQQLHVPPFEGGTRSLIGSFEVK